MPARVRRLVLLPLLLLAGCLEIEAMEITVVADPAHDRLDVMIVSRGIFSSETEDNANLQHDLEQLLKCRDVSALPIPGIGVADFTKQDEREDDIDWQRSVLFLDIEPGAFFLDEQGRLSFYQFMRINRLAEFTALAAAEARAAWRQERAKASPQTRACIDAALRDGIEPLTIDGAGFIMRRPISLDEHRVAQTAWWRALVRGVERAVTEAEGASRSDATQRGWVQMMRDNDVAMVRRTGVTEYYIGTQGSERCEYQVRGPAWRDNLLQKFAASEPPPPKVSQALVDKQFAAFRERAARLPKAYLAARERAQAAAK